MKIFRGGSSGANGLEIASHSFYHKSFAIHFHHFNLRASILSFYENKYYLSQSFDANKYCIGQSCDTQSGASE